MSKFDRTILVLVVDDETAVRQFMTHILRRIGCTVLEAANAADGLALFRSHSIHLAIIDFILPSVSGLDLAAELDRQRPGTKILYTSGCIDSVAMDCIARQRPDLLLAKPFTPAMLVRRVHALTMTPTRT